MMAPVVHCSPIGADDTLASGSGGFNSSSAPGAETETDTDMTEQHRRTFNLRMFPDLFDDGKLKDVEDHPNTCRSFDMSQKEWEEAINIVMNYGPKLERDATEEQISFRRSLGFTKSKKWFNMIEIYKVDDYTMPGSNVSKKRLLRLHKRTGWTEEKWLICIPQLEVFDAIFENHVANASHMKKNATLAKVHEKFYNITEKHVYTFVDLCDTCNNPAPVAKKQKVVVAKPISSNSFRDRFQIHFIDMRKCEKEDVYGNTMRWILYLKDLCTQLTYLAPLPTKKASFVAYELDRIFGLIGYPSILHSDNAKEFTANEIIALLKEYNGANITVTGRPRKPGWNGSLVRRIIRDLENEDRLKGKEPNWINFLGRVMQTINSKCGRGKNDCEAYQAVFGQSYHQHVTCSLKDMRKCTTIDERLKLCPDDRLKKVANEFCILNDESTSWNVPRIICIGELKMLMKTHRSLLRLKVTPFYFKREVEVESFHPVPVHPY